MSGNTPAELIERMALAMCREHDDLRADGRTYALTSYKAGASTDYWDALATAAHSEAAKALSAALNRGAGIVDWQLIETAPEDDTLILVWNSCFVNAAVNRWGNGWDYAYGCSECRDDIFPVPTHWMPLPPPPVTEGDT